MPSVKKWYPFHIPSLEIKFALIKTNHKTRTFSPLFLSLPSHISQVVKSLSFHIPEARKKVPLSDGAPGGITNFTVSLECSDLQSANSS